MRKFSKLRLIFGIAVGTTFLLSIGCNNVFKQRRLAEQSMSTLQAAWNRDDCASIYDESDGYFRRNQPRDKWLAKCADLRKQLGTWQNFRVRDGAVWPFGSVGIVWVEGSADFVGGPHKVRADFTLEDNDAKLFNLQLLERSGGCGVQFEDAKGQYQTKRVMEAANAGGHYDYIASITFPGSAPGARTCPIKPSERSRWRRYGRWLR